MYKVNSCIFIKILLIISVAFSQGCSDKKANNKYITSRRAPESNPMIDDSQQEKIMAQKDQASVKRAKGEYDAYQDYQSNEAPVSLKDLKRIKRRPVLNIKELNAIMDSKSNGHHIKKSKSHTSHNIVDHSKKPCTEAHCDLKKVITYNKQQAKKVSTTAAVVPSSPSTVMPKVVVQASPAAKEMKPVVLNSSAEVSHIVPSSPSIMPKVVVPASPAAKEMKPVVHNSSAEVSPIVPSSPSAVMPKVVVPTTAAKEISHVVPSLPVMPKVISPIPPIPAVNSVVNAKELSKVDAPSAVPNLGNEPVAKFTESQSKNKIGTVNTLLIKFYFNIKNKIHSLFVGGDE